MYYEISADVDWISCSPGSGELSAGDSVVIDVVYSNDSLDEGNYLGVITIIDTNDDNNSIASNSGLTLTVNLTYSDLPIIEVDPADLSTYTVQGQEADSRQFILKNTGQSALNYQISTNQTWLTCSPLSGNLSAGDSELITVTFVNTDTLSAGYHEATITIIDNDTDGDGVASNSPFEYDVGLIVYAEATGSVCGDVPVYTENLVSPAILVLLDVSSSMTSLAPYEDADKPHTPDLSAIVAEIVGRAGWSSGNSMVRRDMVDTCPGRR